MMKNAAFARYSALMGGACNPEYDRTLFMAGWDACAAFYDGKPAAEGDGLGVTAEIIYQAYPRKEGRQAALKAIARQLLMADGHRILANTKAYASAVAQWSPQARFTRDGVDTVPHPATWFNQGRYDDDPNAWVRETPNKSIGIRTA